MDFDFTPEQEKLRKDFRARLEAVMTPERRAAISGQVEGGAAVAECRRALGEAGLLGVAWPTEYGGGGLTAIEQYIFAEEARRVNAPLPLITLNTVGPTLIQFGTDEQKKRFLPAILSGTVDFAIGYSEPGAGSDLASLRTTAVRDGDHYAINGSKIFTSGAEYADYIWLAARTDPQAKKHKGITLFIVPTSAPGFSWKPLHTMPGVSTYYTFYDNVRVPASAIVGRENDGWKLVTNQLNLERAALGNLGALEPLFEKTLAWAKTTPLDEGFVIDQSWVQHTLARVEAQVAAYRLLNLRVNSAITAGGISMGEASAAKVFGTELTQQVARELLEVLGEHGTRKGADAPLRGELEQAYRLAVINTFGGGANELQRDIIAMAGLGMPRAPRDQRADASK
ncbi:acyl-CoA dehydrogenase [Mycobacterium heckeshornense]|uniref:Acyl-CoA dehydrogenase n=1 Tax=Mycobacterium heckeshornense TaxID=110505 RepID=A0A2G8B318_9MYCO|nr:acyl-CoA dehydrogenase family protein [Mycobacterium heckeshornense]KMV19099.1 acyl-CoA dehydrogenase [Mycobacterium heckeshornense]MCV7036012.1 acyl-CoA dehydrogenase family protein [Mycobacterium heckeshornense]PIJ32016.1 acyl-CoA dehydrogenase [Mycobacterium heckeshornense]BCO34851.1 acyl-CoA dehydrogenase [Mycobacterium heckeshornense]BCQ08020.1 acyl-CoA dehydrogenase FadE26 [Mycobacterium heckeshornense]